MPEYSSTTITPADGVQVPSMNGSAAGNFLLSALRDYILASKGQANGLASLDGNGKLTAAQLPDLADDVIVVDSYSTLPAIGTASKIYITADNNKMYRWDPELTTPDYVELSIDLSEYARIVDIQDGNIQAGVAVKAFQDAMGRAIITTYETKADASDLKSAIQGNSQRIENLEVAVSGSLVQTNTDATMANTKTITNANEILPWAILKRVGARAVAWNQLLNKVNLRPSSTQSDISCTNNEDGTFTIAGTATADSYTYLYSGSIVLNPSHKYLVFGNSYMMVTVTVNGSTTYFSPSTDLISGASELKQIFNRITNGSTVSYTVGACIFDLTAMGEYDSTLTDAQNIAKFRAKFPASYYPYNTGEIIPLNPSAFKVVGKQKWDEEWEEGQLNSTTGQPESGNNRIRSKNFISVEPSTAYYGFFGSLSSVYDAVMFCYDINKQYLGFVSAGLANNSNTTLANTHYIKFYYIGSTYNHDIMICLNSVTDKTYEEYKETTIDTSFTSDYKYVNESCHDYSENVLVNGVMRREEHIVAGEDVITNSNVEIDTTRTNSTRTVFRLTPSKPVLYPVAYSDSKDTVPYLMMAGFTPVAQNSTWASGMISSRFEDKLIYIITEPDVTLGSFLTTYGGHNVLYEVAESTSLHDPISNIPCEDGTTVQAVTPQTDLVNSIDVPSTIAYMTKISS